MVARAGPSDHSGDNHKHLLVVTNEARLPFIMRRGFEWGYRRESGLKMRKRATVFREQSGGKKSSLLPETREGSAL